MKYKDQYKDLMEQIVDASLDGTLVTHQLGRRGYLSLSSFDPCNKTIECSRSHGRST